ncbi:MAG: hypothetical protein II921_02870 [Treponema sp.]|nr:hypothetical protein [Treponema sp.]
MNRLNTAISYVNTFVATAPKEEPRDEEHWLWCYYQQSKKILSPDCVEDITQLADKRAGFHARIGGDN